MTILVTGSAGFIGFHLTLRLLKEGFDVLGIDNLNDYYDVNLKIARLKKIKEEVSLFNRNYSFEEIDLCDKKKLDILFEKYKPLYVFNLAAQAGVRYSVENPDSYIKSNLIGFSNLIEISSRKKVKHFIYASSSSVYGGNFKKPFSEMDNVDHPVSFYAATKRSNELVAHCYSHLYNLPTTGLRLFTVYGPWGRPDMSLFIFTKSIIENQKINLFNNGKMLRDFTYIDDVIESMIRLLNKIPSQTENYDFQNQNPQNSWAPFKIFNIGNSNPIKLMDYIEILEDELGKKAKINYLPMQSGDVSETFSSSRELEKWINFKPKTLIKFGIKEFVNWYKDYYKISF